MGQSNSSPGKGDLEITAVGSTPIAAGTLPDTGVEAVGSTPSSAGGPVSGQGPIAQLAAAPSGAPDHATQVPLAADAPRRWRKQLNRQRRIRSPTPLGPSTQSAESSQPSPFAHQLDAGSLGGLPSQSSMFPTSLSATATAFQPADLTQKPLARLARPPPITASFAPPVVHFGDQQQPRLIGRLPPSQAQALIGPESNPDSAASGFMTPLFVLLPQQQLQLQHQLPSQKQPEPPQQQQQQEHPQQQQQRQQQQQFQFQVQQPAFFFPVAQPGSHLAQGHTSATGESSHSSAAAPSYLALGAPSVSGLPASHTAVPAPTPASTAFTFTAPAAAPLQNLFTIGAGPAKDGGSAGRGAAGRAWGRKEHPVTNRPHVTVTTVNNMSAAGGLETGVISHTTYTYASGSTSPNKATPTFPARKGTSFPLFCVLGRHEEQHDGDTAASGTVSPPPPTFDFQPGALGSVGCAPPFSPVPFQFDFQSASLAHQTHAFPAAGELSFAAPPGSAAVVGDGDGGDGDSPFAFPMGNKSCANPANLDYPGNPVYPASPDNNDDADPDGRSPGSPEHNDRQAPPARPAPKQRQQQESSLVPSPIKHPPTQAHEQHPRVEPLFPFVAPLRPPGAPLLPVTFPSVPAPDIDFSSHGSGDGLADGLANLVLGGGLGGESAGVKDGGDKGVGPDAQHLAESPVHMPGIPATANYYDTLFAPATGAHFSAAVDPASLFNLSPPLFQVSGKEQPGNFPTAQAELVPVEMPVTRAKANSPNGLSGHSVAPARATVGSQVGKETGGAMSNPYSKLLRASRGRDVPVAVPINRCGRALSDGDDEPNEESDGSGNTDDYSDDDSGAEDDDAASERRKARGFVASDRGSRARRRKLCRPEVAHVSAKPKQPAGRTESPLPCPLPLPETAGTSAIFRDFAKKEVPPVLRSGPQESQGTVAEFENVTFDFVCEDQDSDDILSRPGPAGKVRQVARGSGASGASRPFSAELSKSLDESPASGDETDQDSSDNPELYRPSEANVVNVPQLLEDSEDLLRRQQWKREQFRQQLQMQQAQHLAHQQQQQHLQMQHHQIAAGHAKPERPSPGPTLRPLKGVAVARSGQPLQKLQGGPSVQLPRAVHSSVPSQLPLPPPNVALANPPPQQQRPVLQSQAPCMPQPPRTQPQQIQQELSAAKAQHLPKDASVAEGQNRIPANSSQAPPNAFAKEKAGSAAGGTGVGKFVKGGVPSTAVAASNRPRSMYLGKGPRPSYEVRRRKFLTAKPTDWICAFCEYEQAVWPDGEFFSWLMGVVPSSRPVGRLAGAVASERREGQGKKKKKKKVPTDVTECRPPTGDVPAPKGPTLRA